MLNREWRAARYLAGDWPSLPTVARHYGGLTAAIFAAGLQQAPQSETVEARAARRRHNRLALVGALVDGPALNGQQLDAAVARVTAARRAQDPEELEDALMRLASCALGLADVVHDRQQRRDPDAARRAAGHRSAA
jgi:hypothetical protein